jgi:hypothetical protein
VDEDDEEEDEEDEEEDRGERGSANENRGGGRDKGRDGTNAVRDQSVESTGGIRLPLRRSSSHSSRVMRSVSSTR